MNNRSSFWIDTARNAGRRYPALNRNGGNFDVAVVGGGIFGLSTAARLAEQGVTVGVVEAKEVGKGVTGCSTAKLSSLHNVKYQPLHSKFGTDVCASYAHLNQSGLESIADTIQRYNIECEYKRVDNCTYTGAPEYVETLREEAVHARDAGLAVEFIEGTPPDLPFETLAYIRLPDQIQFNSYSYCVGLAESLVSQGSVQVFENSMVTKIKHLKKERRRRREREEREGEGEEAGEGGSQRKYHYRLKTAEGGTLQADFIVVATHIPFTDISGHFAFEKPVVSYCMAFNVREDMVRGDEEGGSGVEKHPMIQHMYINPETPSLSVRSASTPDGNPVIVVASAGHNMAEWPTGDARDQYHQTEELARQRIPYLGDEIGRWMAEDFSPTDSLPYIGYLNRFSKRIYTATGFNKWGLAACGGAALLVRDLILQRTDTLEEWAEPFDARRWDLAKSIPELAKINLKVGAHFVGDRVRHLVQAVHRDIEDLALDSGGICRFKGREVAAYKDSQGQLYALSPVCTHLGCHVRYNTAERSWDCPCHGSRFSYTGEVLHGPAVTPLKEYNLNE